MSKYLISAAVIALAGTAAHAQEAYITQMGDGNTAVNISQRSFNVPGTQVIEQDGDNLSAANLSRGRNNDSWTFQRVGDPRGTATSLTLQTGEVGDGFNGGQDNVAVSVINVGPGARDYVTQAIQSGNSNVAVNWIESGGSAVPQYTPNFSTPTLSLNVQQAMPSVGGNFSLPFNGSGSYSNGN